MVAIQRSVPADLRLTFTQHCFEPSVYRGRLPFLPITITIEKFTEHIMATTNATHSLENRAATAMADLSRNGLTAAGFCRLMTLQGQGMGASKFSQALAGIKPFDNQEGMRVLTLLNDLVELRDSHLPLPISLRDPTPIAPLLEERRRLRRDVPEPRIFSVAIRNGRHFLYREKQRRRPAIHIV